MTSDTYVLAQACALLCDGPLKARDLHKRLAARGVVVGKGDLNRVLSNAKRSIVGLDISAEHGWSFTSAIAASPSDDVGTSVRMPRTRLDRFTHQLAWHLRQLEKNEEPTDLDLSRLRELGGGFAAREVELLVQRREELRAARSVSAAPPPFASASLAVGSQPHRWPSSLPLTASDTARENVPLATIQPAATDAVVRQPKAKRKKATTTIKAERRDDGVRVERWYDAHGVATLEIAAKIKVQQLGSDDTGVVYLTIWDMPGAQEHFEFAKEKVKTAGGKYSARKWRFSAAVGLRVVAELAAEGYEIEREPLDLDKDIYNALSTKFLGPEQYRSEKHPIVGLSSVGFVIEMSSGEQLPCTVGEAIILDEAGWTLSPGAFACVATIRSAAGFANSGRGTLSESAPNPSTRSCDPT